MAHSTSSCFSGLLGTAVALVGALLFAYPAAGLSQTSAGKPAFCAITDVQGDDSSDIQTELDYETAIQQLLAAQKFADLDCIANAARSGKARFADGRWKLNVLYWALAAPQGHATEEDWAAHLKKLQHWASARPRSITARLALANAYTDYAWDARGSDYAGTVTQSGWRLLGERTAKAKAILARASQLRAKCPHWYAVMQKIALVEGWDHARVDALLDQAIAFEPDYYYYYRNHANYLKTQWYGEEGDAEKFAEQAADRVGGAKGDILYFQIAVELVCHCSAEPNLKLLSWQRIQSGVVELEKQYGESLTNLNLLAYMAIRQSDGVVAHRMFTRIGENWDKATWRTRPYFESSRNWAVQNANYNADPGHQIIVQAQGKFAAVIAQCTYLGGGDMTKFVLLLGLQKDGIVESVFLDPPTKVGSCLTKLKGQSVAPPPYAPFRFKIDVDPAQFVRAVP
jgi:hypothetical protein